MVFYNEKIIIAEETNKALYIFRQVNNKIIMYYILVHGKKLEEKVIINGAIGDFDIAFYQSDLYIVYKSNNNELKIASIKGDNINETISDSITGDIYELNLLINENNGEKYIFYIDNTDENENIFKINHTTYNDGNIDRHIVDKIVTTTFVTPLKVILENNGIYIIYYFNNQICLKEFNIVNKVWSPSFTLTNNNNKLYLDMIIIGYNLHLVYSEYKDDNFSIKYERYYIKKDNIIKEKEMNLSDFGNNTDPILVYHLNRIWVVWKGTHQYISRSSEDNGNSFSQSYIWKESNLVDQVKYKYLRNSSEKGIKIYYSYGVYYPEIKFIGFGKSD